jgi:hypothetical protein
VHARITQGLEQKDREDRVGEERVDVKHIPLGRMELLEQQTLAEAEAVEVRLVLVETEGLAL